MFTCLSFIVQRILLAYRLKFVACVLVIYLFFCFYLDTLEFRLFQPFTPFSWKTDDPISCQLHWQLLQSESQHTAKVSPKASFPVSHGY